MIEFTYLKKIQITSGIFIFIKYISWSLFFIFQGRAIEQAIVKNVLINQLFYAIIGFIVLKLFVMVCDILEKYFKEKYKNHELKEQWESHFPKKLYRDNEGEESHICTLFFEYIPHLFDASKDILVNKVTMLAILFLASGVFIYTQFYIGIIGLSLVFFLNLLRLDFFIEKIDEKLMVANQQKIYALQWVTQYFNAYKEISKNWDPATMLPWYEQIYSGYDMAKKQQIKFHLYRDLSSQLLVELPFLMNTSIVIICVYYDLISLTQMFVWIGFCQFMINASHAYHENQLNKKKYNSLKKQVNDLLLRYAQTSQNVFHNETLNTSLLIEIIMQDNTKNLIALSPGIYRIRGGNGSGKTTLLNIILDYERIYTVAQQTHLNKLKQTISSNTIRLITRDTVVFDCIKHFNSQICGPIAALSISWRNKICLSMSTLFDEKLANQWMKIFLNLENEYEQRKNQSMSSGEKVILSFMRFLASWDSQVAILIIDECDAFLDQNKKNLFFQAISQISSRMAVYISSHDAFLSQTLCLKSLNMNSG